MVQPIVKDLEFLKKVSINYDFKFHEHIVDDLIDTAKSYPECVGLAAIQIGCAVRVFVMKNSLTGKFQPFINPTISQIEPGTEVTSKVDEQCLSVDGVYTVNRYNTIDVLYYDLNGRLHEETLRGTKAQIFQHEYDHLIGKVIGQ